MKRDIRTLSVVLPTYNERDNVVPLLEDLLRLGGPDLEIVVVDDDSPDGTADVVARRFAGDPRVRLAVRKEDRGLAKSIRRGIEEARGDAVLVMDTDFNHDPEMVPLMRDLLGYFDVVVGSRFVVGGGMEDVLRYYCSWLYNVGVRAALGTRVQDNLSGFFAMRRDQLGELDWDNIFHGYGDYFFRLLHEATKLGMSMIEVPVFYRLRERGESKTQYVKVLTDYTAALLRIVAVSGLERRAPAPLAPRRPASAAKRRDGAS
jgi:dolichol-phosphate mannosyltransferase